MFLGANNFKLAAMLRIYVRAALANIKRNKLFSAINIFGLALGMSLCLLIITIVKDQFSYDRFHPNTDRTYRLNTVAIHKGDSRESYATSPLPLAAVLKRNYPYIENVLTLTRGLYGEAIFDNKALKIKGAFTNNEFFNVFGYELLYGNKASAFQGPNALVLTQKTARTFFGAASNPVGKIITIKELGDFIVSGVLKDPPGKSHLEFDALGSDAFLPILEKQSPLQIVTSSWLNFNSNHTYITLKDNAHKPALDQALIDLAKTHYEKVDLGSEHKGYEFFLQPLRRIVPGPVYSNNMGNAMPVGLLWFLGIFALIIIISAGFNYNSLSLAHALSRAKEIGIRKTAGAYRYQLVLQFLIQSVLTSIMSMLVAVFIFHFLLVPLFEGFSIFSNFDISLKEDVLVFVIFTAFSILIGLIAGLFPALYLSSFKPSGVLKNIDSIRFLPKLGLRKVLLTVQFGAALLFIIILINVYRQVNFVMHADYGFRTENIINVDLQGNDYSLVKQAFINQTGVVKISGVSHSIGTWEDRSIDVRVSPEAEKTAIKDYSIDDEYIDNLSLPLAAGKNFTKNSQSNRELHIIVNEKFINHFKLGSPADAIGRQVILGDSIYVSIAGVLKDFHYKPLTSKIAPLVFRYIPGDITQLNVQVAGSNKAQVLSKLNAIWKKTDNAHPFTHIPFEQELQEAYLLFNDFTKLIGIVAFMAVTIACLGLLGLVLFVLKKRVKEVGIRKIMGASMTQITLLLSKSFARLLLIAYCIGLPVGVFINEILFSSIAYKVNLLPGYLTAVILVLLLAGLTIGTQIIRTAFINPVKSLRSE
jgi:putative ABC transport system permease protein